MSVAVEITIKQINTMGWFSFITKLRSRILPRIPDCFAPLPELLCNFGVTTINFRSKKTLEPALRLAQLSRSCLKGGRKGLGENE